MEAARPEGQVRDYGAILWKHRALALAGFTVVVLPVLLYILLIQSTVYQSTAALMVTHRQDQAALLRPERRETELDVDTEVEIMKSPPVLARAASLLDAAGLYPPAWLRRAEWNRIEKTAVVHIIAEAPLAELARDVANAIAESYVEYSRRTVLDTSRDTLSWLEQQLSEARLRLQRDEEKLYDFRRRHPEAAFAESTEVEGSLYSALMQEFMEVQLAAAAAESQLQDYTKLMKEADVPLPGVGAADAPLPDLRGRPGALALLAALSDSQRLAAISAELDAVKAALRAKLRTLRDRHPDIVALREDVAMLQSHYEEAFVSECQRGYTDRRAQAVGLRSAVSEKQKELEEYRNELFRASGESSEYSVLQRNVEAGRMLYSAILARLKEHDLARGLAGENARFIQRAALGTVKDPRNAVKLAFALLCGVLVGVGAAVAADYFDTTLKTPEEAESALRLAVLGTVPAVETAAVRRIGQGEEGPGLVVTLD